MGKNLKILINGTLSVTALFVLYFALLSLISSPTYALTQFSNFWPYLTALAMGFGIQISLYTYLKALVANSGDVLASKAAKITGTTSAVTMVSCCTHYLANLIPILGITGAFSVIGQYQIGIFWVGILLNFAGVVLMISRIIRFKKQYEQ